MKKIIINTILLSMILSLVSCDKFLDNRPKGYTIPQYYDDYALLLNGQSLNFLGSLYPCYLSDDLELSGVNVPSAVDFGAKLEEERACYLFKKGDIFAPGSNDSFYGTCYTQIYTYNVVINNIMSVPDGDENQKKNTRAQALVGRAFAYLNLVNTYSVHYNKATADKDYGVPIVLSEDINKKYSRNTVAQVYNLIINDLEEAVLYLDNATNNPYHPNKTAGHALLARSYLYMGEFESALKNAKEALKYNTQGVLLDYTKYHLKANAQGYWERIIDANGAVMPSKGYDKSNIYIKFPTDDHSSTVFASADLMETFKRDLPNGAIDKRNELFYAKDKVNTNTEMVFPGYTMYVAHVIPNMGITTQELYLTLAECEARVPSGSAQKAMEYLDVLRNKRIVNNKPLVAKDKKDALRIALDERRREMAFWGSNRLIDVKRLNLEKDFAKTVVHNLDGVKYELPANDIRYVMPLPYSVRDFNPNIEQYKR